MMASSLALRLMVKCPEIQTNDERPTTDPNASHPAPPPVGEDGVKSGMLAQQNLAKQAILAQLNRLQSHHLQQGKKHTDQRLARIHVAQDLLQVERPVLEREPTLQVIDHRSNRDRVLG